LKIYSNTTYIQKIMFKMQIRWLFLSEMIKLNKYYIQIIYLFNFHLKNNVWKKINENCISHVLITIIFVKNIKLILIIF
jgi:hypothetical protein